MWWSGGAGSADITRHQIPGNHIQSNQQGCGQQRLPPFRVVRQHSRGFESLRRECAKHHDRSQTGWSHSALHCPLSRVWQHHVGLLLRLHWGQRFFGQNKASAEGTVPDIHCRFWHHPQIPNCLGSVARGCSYFVIRNLVSISLNLVISQALTYLVLDKDFSNDL